MVAIGSGFASSWQFDRHEIRLQASKKVSEIIARSTMNLDTGVANLDEFSRIEMTGQFIGESILIRNRPLDGSNGFWLVSNFQTIQGFNYPTLVGWFPATQSATAVVKAPALSRTQIQITGIARKLEPSQKASDLPVGQYLSIDNSLFNSQTRFFIQTLSTDPAISRELRYVPVPNTTQGPHLFYAWQWLIFGGIAIVGAAWFTKQEFLDVKSKRS
jgi:cytochrome oxidase assembly protein ShyY1